MRCPDCSKFVPFDSDADPEVEIEFDADAYTVSGTVRITNNCEECGQELTEMTFDVDIDVSDEVKKHWTTVGDWKDGDPPLEGHTGVEMANDDASRSDRYETTDRRGKTIKNARYQKHLYGAEMALTFTCECGEQFHDEQWSDEVPGSAMDELV